MKKKFSTRYYVVQVLKNEDTKSVSRGYGTPTEAVRRALVLKRKHPKNTYTVAEWNE